MSAPIAFPPASLPAPAPAAGGAGCPVCGHPTPHLDQVDDGPDGRALLLAECPRCEHRSTTALPAEPHVATLRPLRVVREVASAA